MWSGEPWSVALRDDGITNAERDSTHTHDLVVVCWRLWLSRKPVELRKNSTARLLTGTRGTSTTV